MIITAGRPRDSAGVTVEVFNPYTHHSCRLPDLPGEVRYGHSLCGDLLCGGGDSSSTLRSCLKLNFQTGAFTTTLVSLVEERYDHLCWASEGEGGPTLLIGGVATASRSTELLNSYGLSSSASFSLDYETKYSLNLPI